MNSVIMRFTLVNLVLLLMVTNCKNDSEQATVKTCENFKSLKGIIRVMKSANMALRDVLKLATLRGENIRDDVCTIHEVKNVSLSKNDSCIRRKRDCFELFRLGMKKNGIYRVWPQFLNHSVLVYCDMERHEGGWTVIQRRGEFGKPHISFFNTWNEYKLGFGNLEEEFWLGNDIIFALTNQSPTMLRVDLEDYEGEKRYANYLSFVLRSEVELYTLFVDNYKGTAGDSLKTHKEMNFQTADRGSECARKWKGGWWYDDCFRSNLNGVYYNESDYLGHMEGISWMDFRNENTSLKAVEMKIRPLLT